MWVTSYGANGGYVQIGSPTDVTVKMTGSDAYVTANDVRITPSSLGLTSVDAALALTDELLKVNTYSGYSNVPGYSDNPTGSLWRTEITQIGVVQESTQMGVAGKWYVFANGITGLRLVPPSQGWTTSDQAYAWADGFVASGGDWWT